MDKYNYVILAFLLLCKSSLLIAQDTFQIKNENWYCLQDFGQYLTIKNNHLSAKEAYTLKNEFKTWNETNISKHETQLWVNFKIKAHQTFNDSIFFNGQLFDSLKLYEIVNKQPILISSTGYLIPYSKRPKRDWGTILGDKLPSDTEKEYFLSFSSSTKNSKKLMSYVTVPCMKLFTRKGYYATYSLPKTLIYFFLGAIFIMAMYNLGISLFSLYRDYLLFSLYNLLTVISIFMVTSQHIELGIVEVSDFERNYKYLSSIFIVPSYILFSIRFLDIEKLSKKISDLLKILASSYLIISSFLLLSLFDIAFYSFTLISTISFTIILLVAIKEALKSKVARFFLVANIMIIGAAFVQLLSLYTIISTMQMIVFSFVAITIEIITFSFAVAYKMKVSKKSLLVMKHKDKLQKETLRIELKARKELQLALEEKSRALTTSSVQWLNLNDQLEKLKESIINKYDDISHKTTNKLLKKIDEIKSFEDQWSMFKMHFESVHPGFFTKLEQNYPGLSQNDLKVCAFMKMKLSNKEIAAILNVTVKAIEQVKRRMRKKLQLPAEYDILQYLETGELLESELAGEFIIMTE